MVRAPTARFRRRHGKSVSSADPEPVNCQRDKLKVNESFFGNPGPARHVPGNFYGNRVFSLNPQRQLMCKSADKCNKFVSVGSARGSKLEIFIQGTAKNFRKIIYPLWAAQQAGSDDVGCSNLSD